MTLEQQKRLVRRAIASETARCAGLAVGERRRLWMRLVTEIAQTFGIEPDDFAALFFGAVLDGIADPEAAVRDYRLPAEFEAAVLAEIERRKPPPEADVFNV
jgi:hypothetical protein